MLFKLFFPLFTLFKENGKIKDNHMLNQLDGGTTDESTSNRF